MTRPDDIAQPVRIPGSTRPDEITHPVRVPTVADNLSSTRPDDITQPIRVSGAAKSQHSHGEQEVAEF